MYVDQNLYHGRPVSGQRLDKELRCYDLLDRLGLAYDRADHDAADTIEACAAVEQVLGAGICKNLFLTNRQQTAFYLLLMPGHKPFRTKDLSHQIGSARLSFASSAFFPGICWLCRFFSSSAPKRMRVGIRMLKFIFVFMALLCLMFFYTAKLHPAGHSFCIRITDIFTLITGLVVYEIC